MDAKPKRLDLVRNTIPLKHYSIRTKRAYIDWVKPFNLFHHKRRICRKFQFWGHNLKIGHQKFNEGVKYIV